MSDCREESRWWHWVVIFLGAAILAWILVNAAQQQENPGPPPRIDKIRPAA